METGNEIESVASITDWRHPFEIDGSCVPLEKSWYADWHPWRWSVDRPVLEEALGELSGRSILDVGCQDGWYSYQAAEAGAEVLGIDLREEAVRRANAIRAIRQVENPKFLMGDVEDAQTISGKFDAVLNYGLLYHLADPINVMCRLGASCKRIMAVQTFVHAMDRGPVLHLLRESIDLPGKGATELITTPSSRAVVLMLEEAGFDHVYRSYPVDYNRNVAPTGSNGYWQWSFWYGVKGAPLRETATLRRVTQSELSKNHFGVVSQALGKARAVARRIRGRDIIGGF